MAPQLVARFWSDVKRRLIENHHVSGLEARKLIRSYRQELSRHRVGDAVFNYGEDAAVSTILNAMKNGFPEPQLLQK